MRCFWAQAQKQVDKCEIYLAISSFYSILNVVFWLFVTIKFCLKNKAIQISPNLKKHYIYLYFWPLNPIQNYKQMNSIQTRKTCQFRFNFGWSNLFIILKFSQSLMAKIACGLILVPIPLETMENTKQ